MGRQILLGVFIASALACGDKGSEAAGVLEDSGAQVTEVESSDTKQSDTNSAQPALSRNTVTAAGGAGTVSPSKYKMTLVIGAAATMAPATQKSDNYRVLIGTPIVESPS